MNLIEPEQQSHELLVQSDNDISMYSDASEPIDLIASPNENLKSVNESNIILQQHPEIELISSDDDKPEQEQGQQTLTTINEIFNNEIQHKRADISDEAKRR
ncbi:unnamed protein product, partial [Rotaria sp. Silwood2]